MPDIQENPRQRIVDLHSWYQRNVLPMRLTPEVERLWWEWLKAGYNGPDLRDVIRYIRRQISLGKRNEGALKLSNLFDRSENGFLKFDEDLALARARANLNVDKRLEPVPDGVANVPTVLPAAPHRSPSPAGAGEGRGEGRGEKPISDFQRADMAAQLKALRKSL